MSVNKESLHAIRGPKNAGSVIVAVGGGKGGIGKSFISSNLGIFLANMGFDTIIVDLDLGAPNLHTSLGENPPNKNFHDYLSGQIQNLSDTAVTTKFPKLRLITGANDHKELANISQEDQTKLMSSLHGIKADFTILDLSAGTHTSTLDFFNMAERHIVALTPDPTSIENAYRFMKASFYRQLRRYEKQFQLTELIAEIMSNQKKYNVRTPADLINSILHHNPERGLELKNLMNELSFDIMLNQTRGAKDIQVGESIEAISKKYFGLPVHFLGHIDYDNAVWHALRKRRPLILEYPNSAVYSQVLSIARDLASPHLKKAVI